MDKIKLIWNSFRKLNDLESVPDFGSGVVKYKSDIFSYPMTEEEIRATSLFAGFIDGCQGHIQRDKAGRGNPEASLQIRPHIPRPLPFSFEEGICSENLIEGLIENLVEKVTENKSSYSEQYNLGASQRARFI